MQRPMHIIILTLPTFFIEMIWPVNNHNFLFVCSLEREEAGDLLKRYGGRVTGSISKKTVCTIKVAAVSINGLYLC